MNPAPTIFFLRRIVYFSWITHARIRPQVIDFIDSVAGSYVAIPNSYQ